MVLQRHTLHVVSLVPLNNSEGRNKVSDKLSERPTL